MSSNYGGAEMGKLSVCCVVVLNLALVQTALAEETTTQLTPAEVAGVIKAVTKYLDVVHAKDDTVSKNFDAYFDPATGQVENNAAFAGDREPHSRFNNCMAQQAYPH
jgi:hypothetical protein